MKYWNTLSPHTLRNTITGDGKFCHSICQYVCERRLNFFFAQPWKEDNSSCCLHRLGFWRRCHMLSKLLLDLPEVFWWIGSLKTRCPLETREDAFLPLVRQSFFPSYLHLILLSHCYLLFSNLMHVALQFLRQLNSYCFRLQVVPQLRSSSW